jgi:hypothetical protein
MEEFSPEFRVRFPRHEIPDQIQKSYKALTDLKRGGIHVPTLIPALTETGRMPRLPIKLLVLMQVAIRRSLELADSMVRDANAFSYAPVWMSARSLFELASLIFDTVDKAKDLIGVWNQKAYMEFSEHIDNVLLGFKSAQWHPGRHTGADLDLVAKNILTIIQRIEKKHISGYLSMYELLSEVVHPNYMGMIEAYQKLSPGLLDVELIDSPAQKNPELIAIPLDAAEGSLGMLVEAIGDFEGFLEKFARLAHENNIAEDDDL